MKHLPNILFTICALVFATHQYLQKIASIGISLADSYLDPLLAMPLILHLINIERQWLFKQARLSRKEICGYYILIIFISEIVFSHFSAKFTFDIIDMLLYAVGAILYIIVDELAAANGISPDSPSGAHCIKTGPT
jgi:hypothetical protein